jgi:AMP-binding enzyme C-terminal domain
MPSEPDMTVGGQLDRELAELLDVERFPLPPVGDAARRDRGGCFWVIGRIDDVVNVSGHRLSTAEVESAIVAHVDVAEAAVIGQHDEDSSQAIVAFVRFRAISRAMRAPSRGYVRRSPSGSASSPGRSGSSGPMTCPRRARERSCVVFCATSPRGERSATSRRCVIRRSLLSCRSV